ncbi:MAG: ORF6N domain-containing protein [Lachnospiraceae bacterium]|nr:ORF6N domain-containing protein [Lachnospiraceae bacterium]
MADNELSVFGPIDRERIKAQIFEVRGLRVMLDQDIAEYFGVTTGNLNKAKNRNSARFPENFCFVLTDEEVSLFQSGIAMQTKGVKGGRSNNPTVYTEQGVAMLTSALHTPRAIEASIEIIEAFVEMAHIIKQNRHLLPYEELKALEVQHYQLSDKVQEIQDNMVTKAELSNLISLFDDSVSAEEVLILDGEPFKADVAYQKVYKKAKKSIIVVDDYLGIKTLNHLTRAKNGIDITIISDNKGYSPLRLSEYNDFLVEYPGTTIKFLKTKNKVHDRYIILDYNQKTMKIYHCGASSKDAGNKVTTITEIKEVDVYKTMINDLLSNPVLNL